MNTHDTDEAIEYIHRRLEALEKMTAATAANYAPGATPITCGVCGYKILNGQPSKRDRDAHYHETCYNTINFYRSEVHSAKASLSGSQKRVAHLQGELVSMERRAAEAEERVIGAVSLYSKQCDRNISLQHLITSLQNERIGLERLRDELARKLKESQAECLFRKRP
jgi:predicted RNase H-like nuclease (RuvC/YqgF family)